ncbi:hypothetical protein LZ31DRAFT_550769 [Colletotrichum somersetense]|nr:hypothetical protein LZ31DRAFT_550769 [Colletotrichum somersetense]
MCARRLSPAGGALYQTFTAKDPGQPPRDMEAPSSSSQKNIPPTETLAAISPALSSGRSCLPGRSFLLGHPFFDAASATCSPLLQSRGQGRVGVSTLSDSSLLTSNDRHAHTPIPPPSGQMGANACAVTRRCRHRRRRHHHCHRCDASTFSKTLSRGTSQRLLSREHAPRRRG